MTQHIYRFVDRIPLQKVPSKLQRRTSSSAVASLSFRSMAHPVYRSALLYPWIFVGRDDWLHPCQRGLPKPPKIIISVSTPPHPTRHLSAVGRVLSGVAEGQKLPPPIKMPSFPRKILLSLQYISNYTGKTIQTRLGQCTHCNVSQTFFSQNAPDCFLACFPEGAYPRIPMRFSLRSATRDFSPKQ